MSTSMIHLRPIRRGMTGLKPCSKNWITGFLRSKAVDDRQIPHNDTTQEAPLKTSDFEHKSSDGIIVVYTHELAFLSDLIHLTPAKTDYGGLNVVPSAQYEVQ